MADINLKLDDFTLVKELAAAVPKLNYNLGGARFRDDLDKILTDISGTPGFGDPEFSLFRCSSGGRSRRKDATFDLWQAAVSGALHVLKWHDRRENPGEADTTTEPDVREFVGYYQVLRRYEPILYGSDPRYRDHFAHVLRVWMTGIVVMLRLGRDGLQPPPLTGSPMLDQEMFSMEEQLAMFTVAALTHDMGYPLQKMAKLNEVVGELLHSFGGVDWQQLRVNLSLPQHEFAQGLLKQLASHPRYRERENKQEMLPNIVEREARALWDKYKTCKTIAQYKESHRGLPWAVMLRCQWKYHQKYGRSLEQSQHGLPSALLLQRKLLYFREGEFALEEDYPFRLEEARQFMVRRDILRAVASHTCSDIYFLSPISTEAILFFCDEIQDWGRPYFNDLYHLLPDLGTPRVTLHTYDKSKISWSIETENVTESGFAWKIFSTATALCARLRSAPETEGRKFGVRWRAVSADLELNAEFEFDEATKQFRCIVKNTAGSKQEDLLDILETFFAGSLNQEGAVEELQAKFNRVLA